jgi:hypothetical protein
LPRSVELRDGEVVVRLTGLSSLAALKRELRIPLAAVRSVSTDRYAHDGLRLGGAAIPFTDIRAGRFRRDRRRTFLSFEDRARVLTLELDRSAEGVEYDVVAVGTPDAEHLASAIGARLRAPR